MVTIDVFPPKNLCKRQAVGHNWAMGYSLLTSILDNTAALDFDLLPFPEIVDYYLLVYLFSGLPKLIL